MDEKLVRVNVETYLCPECGDKKTWDGKNIACGTCGGRGYVEMLKTKKPVKKVMECPNCSRFGMPLEDWHTNATNFFTVEKTKCVNCGGKYSFIGKLELLKKHYEAK